MNELKLVCFPAFGPYRDELVITTYQSHRLWIHFDWPSNLTVELAIPYWQCMRRSGILASAARLSLRREQGTGVGPREIADLIRPTNASRGGT